MRDLVDLWESWETRPGNAACVARLEDGLTGVARVLGITPTALREVITEELRQGASIAGAIDAAMRHVAF